MAGIVKIQIERLAALLADRKIGLELDQSALEWLATDGYDSTYGARPLKRVIQRNLQNRLAEMLLEGSVREGETVRVSAGASGLMIGGWRWRRRRSFQSSVVRGWLVGPGGCWRGWGVRAARFRWGEEVTWAVFGGAKGSLLRF
jgi:hypothetical protein